MSFRNQGRTLEFFGQMYRLRDEIIRPLLVSYSSKFNLHFRLSEEGHYVLADLPTVLSTLNESIKSRRRIHADLVESQEWNILETQELERFANKCALFKDTVVDKYPSLSPQPHRLDMAMESSGVIQCGKNANFQAQKPSIYVRRKNNAVESSRQNP